MESNKTQEKIIEDIKKILDDYIQPAVSEHGGYISFKSFNNGILNLMLGGACSGCAGSMMTLKMGVEQMIMHHIPEVTSVEAEDDPDSNVNPFYTYDPFLQSHYMDYYDESLDNENK